LKYKEALESNFKIHMKINFWGQIEGNSAATKRFPNPKVSIIPVLSVIFYYQPEQDCSEKGFCDCTAQTL